MRIWGGKMVKRCKTGSDQDSQLELRWAKPAAELLNASADGLNSGYASRSASIGMHESESRHGVVKCGKNVMYHVQYYVQPLTVAVHSALGRVYSVLSQVLWQ